MADTKNEIITTETYSQWITRILGIMTFCNQDAQTTDRFCPSCFKQVQTELLELKEALQTDAIQIVADLLNNEDLWMKEREANPRWYLGNMKLGRVFHHLTDEKYLKETPDAQ